MTASMSVLLWALEPVIILVLAYFLLHEPVTVTARVAIALAVAGVLVVVYQPDSGGSSLGIALVGAAVSACAVYTVASRVWIGDSESLRIVLAQQASALAFACLVLLVATIATADDVALSHLDAGAWLAVGASGALYYGIAFWLYLSALRDVPATIAGGFLTLIPVFGLVGGYLVGEKLSGQQWIGAAIVLCGVGTLAISPARERPTA